MDLIFFLPFICKTKSNHAMFCLKSLKPSLWCFVNHLQVCLLLPNLIQVSLEEIFIFSDMVDLLLVLDVKYLNIVWLPAIVLCKACHPGNPLYPRHVILTLQHRINKYFDLIQFSYRIRQVQLHDPNSQGLVLTVRLSVIKIIMLWIKTKSTYCTISKIFVFSSSVNSALGWFIFYLTHCHFSKGSEVHV